MADASEHQPAHLPRSEADLAEWSVYADHLLSIGDPRGELIAYELALPAALDRRHVAGFQTLAHPLCPRWSTTPAAWCLGHIRTLSIVRRRGPGIGTIVGPKLGSLARATDLLARPVGRLVERLAVDFDVRDDAMPRHYMSRWWRRLFRALAGTCTTLAIGILDDTTLGEIVWDVPPTVRTLELSCGFPYRRPPDLEAVLGGGRFGTILLEPGGQLDLDSLAAATVDVELRARHAGTPRRGCRFGAATDAAVIHHDTRSATLLVQPTVLAMQDRFGVSPVRTQLARILPERYLDSPRWEGYSHAALVRRGDVWTFRRFDGEAPAIELRDGDTFGNGDQLVASDVDARCRAALGVA